MKHPSLLFCLALFLLYSCSKEKSEEGTGPNKGTLLMRTVAKIGTDSIATLYGYDANKRLINYEARGFADQSQFQFVRNPEGIIQQVVIKNDQFAPFGGSVTFKMNYDAAKKQYPSRVARYSLSAFTVKDSIAYTYDGSGRVIKEEEFLDDGTTGGYEEAFKTEYSYDTEGNIVKSVDSEFDPVSGKYEAVSEITYEYDTEVNPLKLSIEAFILQSQQMTSTHNVTKIAVKDLIDPADSETTTIVYTYKGDKKPETAAVSSTAFGGAVINANYFYQ